MRLNFSDAVTVGVITALSTLLSVLINQLVSAILSSRTREHERKILLRMKYEELTGLVTEAIYWFDKLVQTLDANALRRLGAPPPSLRRVKNLAVLYFPKVGADSDTLPSRNR